MRILCIVKSKDLMHSTGLVIIFWLQRGGTDDYKDLMVLFFLLLSFFSVLVL